MPESKPFLLSSLFCNRCPRCRKGAIFTQKSVFPLKKCLEVQERCHHCGGKIKVENNFGQGMNFVFIVAVFVCTLVIYWPLFGISFRDNSVFYYLAVGVALSLLLQPWLMRLSRTLFLYLVIPYGKREEQH